MPGDSKRVICILVATFSYMEQESVEGEDILKHTRGLNKIEICSYFTIKPYILDTCSSVTTSRATSGDRKNDPNTSGQR